MEQAGTGAPWPSDRFCVYTTLIGGYEKLNAQPMARASRIPFICLTDDLDLDGGDWTVRQISPVFPQDPIRSQRDLKLRPHLHLPDFDVSLYIDNSVVLTADPEEILARLAGASGFSVPLHDTRPTVMDEFLEVSLHGLDDQGRIFEQMNHYLMSDAEVLEERPFWTAILLRRHDEPAVMRMLEIWTSHVLRYSRRDQLSFNAACRLAGFHPDTLEIAAAASWFHTWPVLAGRERQRGTRAAATSLAPPLARMRAVEMELDRERIVHQQTFAALVGAKAELEAARAKAVSHATDAGQPGSFHTVLDRLIRLGRTGRR
jgi:hypothetical protein